MKVRHLGLLLALTATVGCGVEGPADPNGASATVPTQLAVDAPNLAERTRLGLLRQGRKVRVGDGVEYAFQVFEHPRRFFEFSQLPPTLQRPFEARGWESGSEGFGVILFEDAVAACVHQIERTGPARLLSLLDDYTREFGRPTTEVRTQRAQYWFWEESEHRLALVATENLKGEVALAVAVGDLDVMAALGFSPEAARVDAAEADRMFRTAEERRVIDDR
jgi:hypothetical protein